MRALYKAGFPQNGRILGISVTQNYMTKIHLRERPADQKTEHEYKRANIRS